MLWAVHVSSTVYISCALWNKMKRKFFTLCTHSFKGLKLWIVQTRLFPLLFNFKMPCKVTCEPWYDNLKIRQKILGSGRGFQIKKLQWKTSKHFIIFPSLLNALASKSTFLTTTSKGGMLRANLLVCGWQTEFSLFMSLEKVRHKSQNCGSLATGPMSNSWFY